MSYWKIEYLEKHFKVEKEDKLNEKMTITKGYLNHLETQLRLMKEAFEEGKKCMYEYLFSDFKTPIKIEESTDKTGRKDGD